MNAVRPGIPQDFKLSVSFTGEPEFDTVKQVKSLRNIKYPANQ